jgi:hypothetical protein
MAPSADPIASKTDDLRIARNYLRDGWFVCRDEEEAKWWKGFAKCAVDGRPRPIADGIPGARNDEA